MWELCCGLNTVILVTQIKHLNEECVVENLRDYFSV